MPEDPNAGKDEGGGGGGGGLLSGTRGWVLVIAIVVIEAIFFSVLLVLKEDKKPVDTNAADSALNHTKLDDYARVSVDLKNLTYSIPTPSGVPVTLAMSLTMTLEPTPREISDRVNITDMDWEEFKSAVTKMQPMILDRLNSKINKMSVNELNTTRGQDQIRDFVKETVNSELGRINLKLSNKDKISTNRVQRVLITNYYIQ